MFQLSPDATMDEKLDELYFHLPIMRGEIQAVANVFGVYRGTIRNWLYRLRDEGLAEFIGHGWVKCYDWSNDDGN
jgi:transposase